MYKTLRWGLFLSLLWAFATQAASRFDDVEVVANKVGAGVYMLTGAGGNIGASAGEDGIMIIDDQYAPMAERIAKALGGLGSEQPRYIINTHYHGDHTGSNEYFHDHHGATIFAHENVRIRLQNDDSVSVKALPVVTYADGIKLHFNDEIIHVRHLPGGHTDGDSIVWFENANVIHTGDLFFNGLFPYIDKGAGGSVAGYIESINAILTMANDDTVIIPGHGPLANKADYQSFLAMIEATRDYVAEQKAAGMSLEALIEKGLEQRWKSYDWSFITEERWIRTLY